jgi:hypothetical protein
LADGRLNIDTHIHFCKFSQNRPQGQMPPSVRADSRLCRKIAEANTKASGDNKKNEMTLTKKLFLL